MTTKIGLITTIRFNIGDDLIREGVRRILEDIFAGESLEFVLVDKHQPYQVPSWHPVGWLPRGRSRVEKLLFRVGHFYLDQFDDCDCVVQCGAPVVWPNCHQIPWASTLWPYVGRLSERIPVLNLAAGSCFPWERQPTRVTPAEARYLKSILSYCRLTTTRDRLAQQLFADLGTEAPLYPCAAFLAQRAVHRAAGDRVILVNFMNGAGHFEWDQAIDHEAWTATARSLIQRLLVRHKVQFLCHDQAEYDLAHRLYPGLPRILPRTAEEYLSQVAHANVTLCNRIHAAVALAGLGIPSVVVGTDTRLLAIEAFGLTYFYVKDAKCDALEESLERLVTSGAQERERLMALKEKTWQQYVGAVRQSLDPVLSRS